MVATTLTRQQGNLTQAQLDNYINWFDSLTDKEKCEILDIIDEKVESNKEITKKELVFNGLIFGRRRVTQMNFYLNGCDINENERPTDPNMAYIV